MLKFEDGKTMTFEEAAQLVEAEGRLIVLQLYSSKGERCVRGVIEDWSNESSIHGARSLWGSDPDLALEMVTKNNFFEGTPEERATYIAAWLREQTEVEKVS